MTMEANIDLEQVICNSILFKGTKRQFGNHTYTHSIINCTTEHVILMLKVLTF